MKIIVKIFIAVGFNDIVCKPPEDGDYAETCRSYAIGRIHIM
jgi:hypothetical protein